MSQPKQHSFFQRLSLLMVGVVSVLAFAYAIMGNNGYLELRRREARNQRTEVKSRGVTPGKQRDTKRNQSAQIRSEGDRENCPRRIGYGETRRG